jgi:predicted ABC-type ATPase
MVASEDIAPEKAAFAPRFWNVGNRLSRSVEKRSGIDREIRQIREKGIMLWFRSCISHGSRLEIISTARPVGSIICLYVFWQSINRDGLLQNGTA